MQELRRLFPSERRFDGCAYGFKGDRTGKFAKNPSKVFANRRPLQKFLNKKCPRDRGHLRGWELNFCLRELNIRYTLRRRNFCRLSRIIKSQFWIDNFIVSTFDSCSWIL